MVTKSSRHSMVEVKCETCDTMFMARKQRVDAGLGRFCSKKCYHVAETTGRANQGKENAAFSWNKNGYWIAYWYEGDKRINSSKSKWIWEREYGEIPKGFVVSPKDGNRGNSDLSNLYLRSREDVAAKVGHAHKGYKHTEEDKVKMSNSHKGKVLSEDHKLHIADNNRKKWADGVYDKVHVGEYNHKWRGGAGGEYPPEFSPSLKLFIRDRDNYQCQICGKRVDKSRSGGVHHIDGHRGHNDPENLILLCNKCHGRIHSDGELPLILESFRSRLHWKN